MDASRPLLLTTSVFQTPLVRAAKETPPKLVLLGLPKAMAGEPLGAKVKVHPQPLVVPTSSIDQEVPLKVANRSNEGPTAELLVEYAITGCPSGLY